MKKIIVDFFTHNEPTDEVLSNALITQLMVTITQIGIRVDKMEYANDMITEVKEYAEKKESN